MQHTYLLKLKCPYSVVRSSVVNRRLQEGQGQFRFGIISATCGRWGYNPVIHPSAIAPIDKTSASRYFQDSSSVRAKFCCKIPEVDVWLSNGFKSSTKYCTKHQL